MMSKHWLLIITSCNDLPFIFLCTCHNSTLYRFLGKRKEKIQKLFAWNSRKLWVTSSWESNNLVAINHLPEERTFSRANLALLTHSDIFSCSKGLKVSILRYSHVVNLTASQIFVITCHFVFMEVRSSELTPHHHRINAI